MTPYEIPLISGNQSLSISLSGVQYHLTVKWNDVLSAWVLDIADKQQVMLVAGIPLVTGTDLISQYAYLGFNGSLYVQTDNNTMAMPTFENLGDNSHLYFVTTS